MNTTPKPCRNCGGNEQYSQEVSANGGHGPALLPLGFFAFAKFEIRVCGGCGLVDWFVPDRLMPKVKAKFTRER
ncbi:MAG: hypothetical protein ABIS50_04260 [Luteolibacter sp.]|uniref:hypothetical protein n=1 Tax=Luteolibacter sp. TaxID=1962973 RepID=UPI0032651AB7